MEVDFENGKINVRDDLVYEFKELVTRKEMKAIKQLRDKHAKLEEEGIEKLSQDEIEDLEIRELTASVYIFLTKFGSTALAKQFVTATKEIQPKDQTQ